MIYDPRKLGLPHNEWRPAQYDAFIECLNIHNSGGGIIVEEAPTGIGKSGIPTALGFFDNVTVLVHNHGLLKQYRDVYGFDIVMGKPEYPCVLKGKVDSWKRTYGFEPTAAECHFGDMYQCPSSHHCPYVMDRDIAMASNRMACTYKYAALSESVQERTGILVCDEAHDFYEEMMSIASFMMDDNEQQDKKFPPFPLIGFGPNGDGDLLEGVNRKTVLKWFESALSKVGAVDLFSMMTPDGVKNQRVFDRLSAGIKLLKSSIPVFYRCSKPAEVSDWRFLGHSSKSKINMQLKSLDVSHTVQSLIKTKKTVILMSATIGNPAPLMNQLGIRVFKFNSYPHPIPKEKRPIYNLGIDKMTKANLDAHPGLYAEQANRIADFIGTMNPSWRGIVLTASNFKINQLRAGLQKRLNGRIHIPQQVGLSAQIKEFTEDKTPGKIAVVTIQGWGSGLSLWGDMARFAVVAGVPYANPGDRFDQIRMSTPEGRNYAFWNAYCAVVQATGRVSRGELDNDGDFMLNIGAIADGSALSSIARSNYPRWFNEAIVQWTRH
jgi:hypothetical protein